MRLSQVVSSIFLHMKPAWIIFLSLLATFVTIILLLFLCFYVPFRRCRSRKTVPTPSKHRFVYDRNHITSSSSIDKRLLAFEGSNQVINMVPLQCGVVRPNNYFEKGLEDHVIISGRRSYSSCHWFSFDEIYGCTDKFHGRNLVGNGCYGKVYRGLLLDGTRVAVKELMIPSVKAEEFRRMVEAIPHMTHKNLVKIIGFCVQQWHTRTRHMIVSEYVGNGNLYYWLHGNNAGNISPLTWRIRMDIISGIAKGLAYMHEDVVPKMVHARLQSHKILLDRHWNPKVSDPLVAKLLGQKNKFSYMTPGLAMTDNMNEKDDVFSFGVLVMEIISGRKPIDHGRPIEEQQLLHWLKLMVLKQNYEQVVDPKIPQLPPLKQLKRVLLIALRCADLDPDYRPRMGEVIHMLEPRDLLLSNQNKTIRRSLAQEPHVLSNTLIDDQVSNSDLRDQSKHSNKNRELAIVQLV